MPDNVSIKGLPGTSTWDDALDVARSAVDQIMDLEPQNDSEEAELQNGYIKAGALIVLGALLVPRDGGGDGVRTIYELIALGAEAVDIELDEGQP